MIKIVYIDDNEAHRYLISAVLETRKVIKYKVVDEDIDVKELVDYDIFLVDYLLGVKDGLELAREIQDTHPESQIYIYTSYDLQCEFEVIPKDNFSKFLDKIIIKNNDV